MFRGVVTASGETLSLVGGGSSVIIFRGSPTQAKRLGGVIAALSGFATWSQGFIIMSWFHRVRVGGAISAGSLRTMSGIVGVLVM